MGLPIIGDIIGAVKDIVSEVVVDKDKRDQVNLELAKLQDQAQARLDAQLQGQIEVNKVEAASDSLFVSGWRPAIGWVGAASLAYSFIISPFLGIWFTAPELQYEYLMTVVTAMLGIGGMKSYERVKGVSPYTNGTAPSSATKEVISKPIKPVEAPVKKSSHWQKI